jgi:hypothetical protein
MQRYRVNLRDRTGRIAVREDIEATSSDEAADMAALLCDAFSDVTAYFEIWDGKARTPETGLPTPLPSIFELSARAQQIVIDRAISIQDTNRRLAESKALLKKLDAWLASTKDSWRGIDTQTIEFR